jgi:hypothetical protein
VQEITENPYTLFLRFLCGFESGSSGGRCLPPTSAMHMRVKRFVSLVAVGAVVICSVSFALMPSNRLPIQPMCRLLWP